MIDPQHRSRIVGHSQCSRTSRADAQPVITIRHAVEQYVAIKIAGGLIHHMSGGISQLDHHPALRLAIGAQQNRLNLTRRRERQQYFGRHAGARHHHHALALGPQQWIGQAAAVD